MFSLIKFMILVNSILLVNAENIKLECVTNAIYFAENETSTDYYAITTPWKITFKGRIKNELKKHNYIIYNKNPTNKCGWKQKVNMDDGEIYYHNNENINITNISMDILSELSPGVELAMIFAIPITFITLCCLYSCYDDKKQKRRQEKEKKERINRSALTPIEPPNYYETDTDYAHYEDNLSHSCIIQMDKHSNIYNNKKQWHDDNTSIISSQSNISIEDSCCDENSHWVFNNDLESGSSFE